MEQNVDKIYKMNILNLRNQLELRGIHASKRWNKGRLLQAIHTHDGTELLKPKLDEFTQDIATLYYKPLRLLKQQLQHRNLQHIRGMKKKLIIERIIKHDGHEVPLKKPPNPNKPQKVKKARKASIRHSRKKRTKNSSSFTTYIYKVLKQVHPDTGISRKAMLVMNDFVIDIIKRVGEEARNLCELFQKKTLTSREIQTAVRLTFKGELAKHAVSEGTKAVTKFTASDKMSGGGKTTMSLKAGLQFPVGRIRTFLKTHHYADRIGRGAPVYLTAVTEYMVAEVLELAGNASRDNKKARIVPRHLQLAVRNDEELNNMLSKVIISGSGVLPNIHAVLIPKISHFKEESSANQEY